MCGKCKYAKEIKGAYCYCRKRSSLMQVSKQANCVKFEPKEEDKDGQINSLLAVIEQNEIMEQAKDKQIKDLKNRIETLKEAVKAVSKQTRTEVLDEVERRFGAAAERKRENGIEDVVISYVEAVKILENVRKKGCE